MQRKNLEAYWRKNIRYVLILLSVWFMASYGFGILFADSLNSIRLGGFKLGFWFAQQGAIYVFVVLIFVYVWLMNRLDREYEVDEEEDTKPGPTQFGKRFRSKNQNLTNQNH